MSYGQSSNNITPNAPSGSLTHTIIMPRLHHSHHPTNLFSPPLNRISNKYT
jgi:hypothetical protein